MSCRGAGSPPHNQGADRAGRKWNQSLELLSGCTSRNSGKAGIRQSLRQELAMNFESAPVEPKLMALFKFLAKVSRQPADIVREDFEHCSGSWLNNEEITEGVLVASPYACANVFSAASACRLLFGSATFRHSNESRCIHPDRQILEELRALVYF